MKSNERLDQILLENYSKSLTSKIRQRVHFYCICIKNQTDMRPLHFLLEKFKEEIESRSYPQVITSHMLCVLKTAYRKQLKLINENNESVQLPS